MIDFDRLVLALTASVFGQPVVYQPASGLPLSFSAVFDDRYRRIKIDDRGNEVVTLCPMLGCRASNFPGGLPTRDETVTVAGRLYRIAEIDADGFGGVNLLLKIPPSAGPDTP